MKFHLFWLDKNWKKCGDCANNYNLIVDMENKTYKVYTNAFYGYYHPEDIEVKKKSDIEDYIEYLKKNGFRGMEWWDMKTITVTIEVYDNSSVEDIERAVSAGLDSNGIDCSYDVEVKEWQTWIILILETELKEAH